MYICSCNPFNDKRVKECLGQAGENNKIKVSDVYRACSGGAKPQCGSCLPMLKDMVMEHNNAASVQQMKEALPTSPVHANKPNEPVT